MHTSPTSSPVVVLDANVLFALSLRDLLFRAVEKGLYRLQISRDIWDEVIRNLIENGRMTPEAVAYLDLRVQEFLAENDALVSGYEALIPTLTNDPKDRHVLAVTMPEVLALALAAGLARDSGDVDTITLGAAIAKLEALVPPDTLSLLRRELARERGNSTAARRSETLALQERAWLERRRARMVYETGMRGGARSERVVEPYHLQRYGRFWILIAYDHLRQAVRDFKIDRIHAAVLLDEHYTIPEDFDVATYRGTTWGLLRGEAGEPVDVELLFSPQGGRWVQEEDRGVPLSAEPRPDGSVLVRLRVGITDEMVRWILGYGPECRVLAPDRLRQRVRTMAEETVGLY